MKETWTLLHPSGSFVSLYLYSRLAWMARTRAGSTVLPPARSPGRPDASTPVKVAQRCRRRRRQQQHILGSMTSTTPKAGASPPLPTPCRTQATIRATTARCRASATSLTRRPRTWRQRCGRPRHPGGAAASTVPVSWAGVARGWQGRGAPALLRVTPEKTTQREGRK